MTGKTIITLLQQQEQNIVQTNDLPKTSIPQYLSLESGLLSLSTDNLKKHNYNNTFDQTECIIDIEVVHHSRKHPREPSFLTSSFRYGSTRTERTPSCLDWPG